MEQKFKAAWTHIYGPKKKLDFFNLASSKFSIPVYDYDVTLWYSSTLYFLIVIKQLLTQIIKFIKSNILPAALSVNWLPNIYSSKVFLK